MCGVKARTWAFRAFLVVLNVAGLIWIHHSLTWTPKPRLRVLSVLPARDVDTADRFSLTFDEPLKLAVAVESVLVDSPFVVEPTVPGEWVWAAPDKVEYRLSKPLPPGRRFKLRPSPSLERLTGRTLVGTAEFTFETKPLRLMACRMLSSDREHVNAELCFNQPVDPAELLRHLKVMDAGKFQQKLEAASLTQAPAERLSIRVPRPASNGLKIEVDGKLSGQGGELALGSKVTSDLAVQPVFALMRADVEPPKLDVVNSTVRLAFTHKLKSDQPVPVVRVTPAVEGLSTEVQDNGLVLAGPFEAGRRYSVTVSGSVLSGGGKPLGEDATLAFAESDREAEVSIPLSDGILSPEGNLMLDLKAVNVAGLTVRAARVHENNLVAHLHDRERKMTARELPEKQIKLDLEHNQVGKLALDLHEIVGQRRGIYLIEAEATDKTWTSDHAVVAITDLAITSKTERDGLYVWVTSLRTARPVEAADVAAVSFNGQTLGSSVTDAQGLARIAVPDGHPDGRPWVLTARHDDDVSYLKLDERTLIAEGVDYSGREIPKTYDVMLYPERGVYRPGDTIHLTGIVRDGLGVIPPAFPLAVRVYRPDGREVANLPTGLEAGRQGVFQVDYATREDGQTGPYRFKVTLPGDKDELGASEALVEEFVPVRLEVKAEFASEEDETPTAQEPPLSPPLVRGGKQKAGETPAPLRLFGPGESVTAEVQARYLFGQPAAELPVKASGKLKRVIFESKQHEGFTFEDPRAAKSHEVADVEETLDDAGAASLELLDLEGLPAGFWRGDWQITVSENGGRSVSAHVTCQVDTAGRHIGLRLPEGRVVRVGSPVQVEWVQVTGEDEPAVPAAMAFTLQKIEQDVSLEDVGGRLVWKTVERATTIKEGEIDGPLLTGAQGRFEVMCPTAGQYRLRVVDCESDVAAQVDVHASDEVEAARMLATGEPERLELVLDKEKYVPGSTAKLLVKSPFTGTLLLTMETDRVIDQRMLNLYGESVELEWPVSEQIRGGAFVSATVVRAVDPARDRWLPHRAFGMARLVTDHSQQELPVTIAAPAKARPGESVSVKVQTSSPRDPKQPPIVHLWAVDEGILMTTAYETPHPLKHFFARRKAAVTMTDIFDELLPDYTRPAGTKRIGGDGGDDSESARRSPVPAPRRAAAVVWSAAVPVRPDGSLVAAMKMPELNGEMRLMAVAVDGDLYGSARRAMTLASPLLVELSGPRFAAPNDEFTLPAKVFNGTDSPVRVSMDVQASGPVEVRTKEAVRDVEIRPGTPIIVWLEAKATGGLGQAKVVVKVTGMPAQAGEALIGTADAMFAIRPTGPLHSETKLLRIKAGETLRLESPSVVSTRPAEQAEDGLSPGTPPKPPLGKGGERKAGKMPVPRNMAKMVVAHRAWRFCRGRRGIR